MKKALYQSLLILGLALSTGHAEPKSISDGKTFDGWEPGTKELWQIIDGAFVGGNLAEQVPHNDFLSTVKSYKNFDLKLKFKLNGTGFVNGGVQFRSERIPNFEMKGYQADMGDPSWWGCLYDESRRNKVLVQSPMDEVKKVLKHDDWNEYRVRCEGPHIQLWINGLKTVDYTEPDAAIPQDGKIGLQIHGGGKSQAWYKEIVIEELPDTPATDSKARAAGKSGALQSHPAPLADVPAKDGPRTPEDERAAFHLPQGFVAELVADESVMKKAVAFNFDSDGRMWVTTASEYPLDGNEQPERATALYRDGGKDAVLIFDTPWASGLQTPRVFAGNPDGARASPFNLAMPMGVLPYKDGAIIQQGPDLLFLRDTDGDGRADKKEVLLSGFGVDDSHLMPHGFTRGPGDWIYFAQGAFNKSHVRTREGPVVDFTYCKMMRMKPDGSRFEIVGWGPCNTWGFVIDPRGTMWAQEANDYGFPMYPFEIGIAIPGIGSDRPKAYAPLMTPPKKFNDCTVGGTGLSGLALSEDASTWPAPYTGAFILANPITNKLQAMRALKIDKRSGVAESEPTAPQKAPSIDGYDGVALRMLGDFLKSDDPRFRPVAIQFGPDGSLYVIDWYNKIISHNEVPRNHPERDKVHTRIWRVRWTGAAHREVPNLKQATAEQLVARLGAANQWEANSARFELIDRTGSEPKAPGYVTAENSLLDAAAARANPLETRLQALWVKLGLLLPLKEQPNDPDAEIRRAVVSSWESIPPKLDGSNDFLSALGALLDEPSTSVRLAAIQAMKNSILTSNTRRGGNDGTGFGPEYVSPSIELLLAWAGRVSPSQESADAKFERAQLREAMAMEPETLEKLLQGDGLPHLGTAVSLPVEGRALACLALPPAQGAPMLAKLLPRLGRIPVAEEISLLASHLDQPLVREPLARMLQEPALQFSLLKAIQDFPPGPGEFAKLISSGAKGLLIREPSPANRRLVVHLARTQRLAELEPEVLAAVSEKETSGPDLIEAVKALRELGSDRVDVFQALIRRDAGPQSDELHREALTALASAKSTEVVPAIAAIWPQLSPLLRRIALDKLISSKTQASAFVKALRTGKGFALEDLDDASLDKLVTVLGPEDVDVSAILAGLEGAMQPVLRLTGAAGDLAETNLDLRGPFTVETWIKLDEGISNEDSILGSKEGPNFNFYDSHLRVYVGRNGTHDALTAKTAMRPDLWSHVAITRDEGGHFRIFIHGELDAEGGAVDTGAFHGMDIGRTALSKGAGAAFAEFRVWDVARTPAEILDNYQRSFSGEAPPPHLVRYFTGNGPWGKLSGQARVQRTRDFPELLTPAAARALDAKFAAFRAMIAQPGQAEHGHALFAATCTVCHRAKNEGASIGPDLSGAGAMGDESLLRNILTPNAQLESGYYRFDVELKSGDLITGFFVREDPAGVVVRPIGADDRTIPRGEIKHTKIARKSIMPDGLLDAMNPGDVADLFAFLRSLK